MKERLRLPKIEEIPDFGLYMDQVITFMDKVYPQKSLTKTMINNYTKDKILYPSHKKKYSREHLMLLSLIQILKKTLSLPEIKTLLGPISAESATGKHESLYSLYEDFFASFKSVIEIAEQAALKATDSLSDEKVITLTYSLISAYFGILSEERISNIEGYEND